jgi:protoporphyrinogen oxidase
LRRKTETLIIGAGVTGCAAAQELQASGRDYLLLEKNAEPGGLTRSISLGEAQFDYTGHFVHLRRCRTPAEIPHGQQKDEDWQLIERQSVVYVNNTVVPAPIQYNLYALPKRLRTACIRDFEHGTPSPPSGSFRDYLLSGFGKTLCEIFLFPYNEKQMAARLDSLSPDMANRFFPQPDPSLVRKGYLPEKKAQGEAYNSFFWYPRSSGIGILAKGLAEGLKGLRTSVPASSVHLAKKTVHTPEGPVIYDRLISTMPLKFFCSISDEPRLKRLAAPLSHNRVFCLNLLFRGAFHRDFTGCQWIYVPDKKLPFYRVGIYSHLPAKVVPASHTSLYVEIAFPMDGPMPLTAKIIDQALLHLEKLRWVSRKNLVALSANWIDCAYVHFTAGRPWALEKIFRILREHNVYPAGRYGLWDYISIEDSIFSGVEAAREIIGEHG